MANNIVLSMDFFTKTQYKLFVQLDQEIFCHSRSVFGLCITSTKKELTEILPGSKCFFDILICQMENRFSYLMKKAFQFGIDHSDLNPNTAIQEFSALPPDGTLEQYTERIQKAVNILSEQNSLFNRNQSERFNEFLDLLKQAYLVNPYLEQIIRAGTEASKATKIRVKKASEKIKPPFSLRQLECLVLAAQGKSRSQTAKILRISYGQAACALDRGSCKLRIAAGAIAEYDKAAMINKLALICNMTERDMVKCIEHIIFVAGTIPQMQEYMKDYTVDRVLHLLYDYCKYGEKK